MNSKCTEVGSTEENKVPWSFCCGSGCGVVLLWKRAQKGIPYSWRRGSGLQRFPLDVRMDGKGKGAGFRMFCSPSSSGFGLQVSLGQEGCTQAAGLFLSSALLLLISPPYLKNSSANRDCMCFFIHPIQQVRFHGLCWNQLLTDTGSNIIFHMDSSKPIHECAFKLLVWAEPCSSVIYLQRRPLIKAGQGSQDLMEAW